MTLDYEERSFHGTPQNSFHKAVNVPDVVVFPRWWCLLRTPMIIDLFKSRDKWAVDLPAPSYNVMYRSWCWDALNLLNIPSMYWLNDLFLAMKWCLHLLFCSSQDEVQKIVMACNKYKVWHSLHRCKHIGLTGHHWILTDPARLPHYTLSRFDTLRDSSVSTLPLIIFWTSFIFPFQICVFGGALSAY